MTGRPVPVLVGVAQELLSVLQNAGIDACVIGGLAVLRWGQPRATADVDVSVLAPYGEEARVLDILLGRYAPRGPGALEFAQSNRVLLITTSSGVPIDVALAAFPFEIEALHAASSWEATPGVFLNTCAAEDLVVYKLVAARPQDLIDVEGIVRRQVTGLDVERIREWGRMLADLKEDPDFLQQFEAALRRARLRIPPNP